MCTGSTLHCVILVNNALVAIQWTGNATLVFAENLTITTVHVHAGALQIVQVVVD